MKTLKKPLSLLMALFMCLGMFAGTGVTAFAAGETMTTYMVDIPRANDPNKAGWGHPALNFLGGWSTSAGTHFSVHTQDAYNGRAIYCIEPGIGVHSGDQYTGRGEDFWDNYPSSLNPTIPPNTIKEYIGRIMTYGWQGNASTSWMSSNPDHANQMAGYIATQLLVWETIVGERDSQFNHVDANAQGKNNVTEYISAEHPLRSQIFSQYSAIESAVKRHTMLPSFFSSTADAGAYELKWDGEKYSATLTDTNGVLGDYTFSSSTAGLNFSVDGSQLTITSSQALKGSVTVKAEKISAQRSGVVVWTDGVTGGGTQDFATYGTTVSDQMVGYLNLEVKTGNMKLIKTSEDGKVEGISFTITGEGYNATKTTNAAGEIDITDLNPGVYTVTEQSIDKYEPQATQRVTIVSGQTATVTFNNVLKRGSLEVTKTSEDGLAEGMTFHLSGTSLSGLPVDEYAVTDSTGVARFENVLIGTGYVLEEVDTPIRYVVPEAQTATIEWNEVTDKTVNNILKKFRVTVTKSDVETGTPQGDGWVVQNLQNALDTWNKYLSEIWQLITQSPEQFKGGSIWSVIVNIHDAVRAIGLALLVLFFVIGIVKTCGSFAEVKKPEHALKLFIRFAIAKGVVTYGLELMMALFNIVQGLVSTIMNAAGFGTAQQTVLPQEIIDAVESCGFFESIPLWAVTLIGGLFITVLSFIMIMTVYGRFFKLYLYTAIAPVPLSTFGGEPSQNVGKSFIKSYAAVCLEGAIIVLACIIFSLFAASPPAVDPNAAAVTQVWSYVGELLFNMLVLVGAVKMADRVVREMMGL